MSHDQPLPEPTDMQAYPEVLVLLWPDSFGVRLLQASAGVVGLGRQLLQEDLMTLPGRPGRVHTKAVAAHIFAVVLFNLHNLGLIALKSESKKIFFVKKTQVVATRSGDDDETRGLSAAALAQFREGDSSLAVRDIVRRWFGNSTPIPSLDVVGATERAAAGLGLYRKVTGRSTATRAAKRVAQATTGGSFVYEPLAELVASTEHVASRMATRWRQFGSDDPELEERLLKDVERAIESMELPEPPDSSN
ncbi:MAG TPA: hypothetical protein VG184_08410 [Acidimicrobiales bacterium]|jgi:hypothetical protein|nr:hypothetical protein [Acidimicrobiales bacterium]